MARKKKLNKAIKNLDEMLDSGVEWSNQKLKKAHIDLRKWLKELRNYRKLERQGRLLWMPCAVGDKAHILEKCANCGAWRINERVITDILINADRPPLFRIEGMCGTVKLEEFGKTVFSTHQEAEEALSRKEWEDE